MADTYTQLYIHIIFSVKGREPNIPKQHKDTVHQYITGIITNKKQKVIQINAMPDHIHILIGLTPDIALSDLIRDVKSNSSKFINKQRWMVGHFEWQSGFGAFSCSQSHLDKTARYIANQEEHHAVRSFSDEYLLFLKRNNVEYNPDYVFDPDNILKK